MKELLTSLFCIAIAILGITENITMGEAVVAWIIVLQSWIQSDK